MSAGPLIFALFVLLPNAYLVRTFRPLLRQHDGFARARAGLPLVSYGLLLLAEQLAALPASLYGLQRFLRGLLLVCGFALVGSLGASALGQLGLLALFSIPAITSYVSIFALLTLLFFRAATRPVARTAG